MVSFWFIVVVTIVPLRCRPHCFLHLRYNRPHYTTINKNRSTSSEKDEKKESFHNIMMRVFFFFALLVALQELLQHLLQVHVAAKQVTSFALFVSFADPAGHSQVLGVSAASYCLQQTTKKIA